MLLTLLLSEAIHEALQQFWRTAFGGFGVFRCRVCQNAGVFSAALAQPACFGEEVLAACQVILGAAALHFYQMFSRAMVQPVTRPLLAREDVLSNAWQAKPPHI